MPDAFPNHPSYCGLRERFVRAATQAGASLSRYDHPLPGPFGEPLSTDVAWLGNPRAERVLVTLSGTHGVEGYYGSDCQSQWLETYGTRELPDDVAILMIHLINPWGTAWMRRVNEDNIDLNRNYIDFTQPLPDNAAYAAIHDVYTCTDLDGPSRAQADARFNALVEEHGWAQLMAIVGAGQYQFADGLFFGGHAPSWSNQTLRQILATHLGSAKVAMTFDLHTGAGEYGHPMLMTIVQSAYPALPDAQSLFGPWLYTLITAANTLSDTGVAATSTGYTSQALLDALPEVQLMPFVIECGTWPGPPMHAQLRADHWLHLHGDPLSEQGQMIKRGLLEQFYPDDSDWQALVGLRTRQIWERALTALIHQDYTPKTPRADLSTSPQE
ncbi:DUF2817 domain-containing protein [Pseudomonas sp. MWU16-30317]|uniref:DUF2817 domain-containing protein n=1 Tax=Pseudomonas sp. MWU16-30317 TaxID=2878095 RepID=UPI001CFA8AFA|nr:DUF2817 domain-containing protein [Pseudomonas sp. MWU16-30317]